MSTALHTALRLIPALLLAFALSGVPHALTTVFEFDDTCASDCDGSMGSKECPPTCTQGACAKVFATVLFNALPAHRHPSIAPPLAPFPAPESVADPRLSPALDSIFHPPKA
jgi:hypothetical protein